MDSKSQSPQVMLQPLKVLSEHKKVIAGGLLFNKVSNESYLWLISNLSASLFQIAFWTHRKIKYRFRGCCQIRDNRLDARNWKSILEIKLYKFVNQLYSDAFHVQNVRFSVNSEIQFWWPKMWVTSSDVDDINDVTS